MARSYKEDPEWQAAHADYVSERDGESPDDQYRRRLRLARRLHEIECRHHGKQPLTLAETVELLSPSRVL